MNSLPFKIHHTEIHDAKLNGRREKQQRMAALMRSNRFTLSGAILFAIVLPELLQLYLAQLWPSIMPLRAWEPELFASAIALALAHVSLRKIGILPLVDDKALILPAIAAPYALMLCLLFIALGQVRLYHPVTSAIAALVWYYIVAVSRTRFATPRIGILSSLPLDPQMAKMPIEWVHLIRPQIHRDVVAVAYDDAENYSPAWENFFSRAVLRKIHIYGLSQLRERLTGRVRVSTRPELIFGQLLPSQPYLRIKWTVDVLAALPVLCIALPVMALVAIMIRIESPGPAIYRQKRVGYQGRIFTCYKLRSMRNDVAGPLYTDERDPRITRIGHFIRKYRIDELPQIFNILKGEMSWIGPRPEALRLARAYERAIPYYAYRHTVRPGITGWAAIHQGNVALSDAAAEKLEYDFYYLKYFSIWLDALIVLLTIRTVLTGFGSR